MPSRAIVLTIALVILFAGTLPVLAAADPVAALDYLRAQQNADGGLGSAFSAESSAGSTADAVLSILAVEGDLFSFNQGGNTPLTYLAANASSITIGGDLAKLILATIAAGKNPREFGGQDSVAKLESMRTVNGRIGIETDTFFSHCLAVLALRSAQRPIPDITVDVIIAAQQENGSWAWDGSAQTAGDTNTTAVAVQALLAAGEAADSSAVTKALEYYQGIQNKDGGWPYQSPSAFGTDTDANSTAVTIQALIAAGQDPAAAAWTTTEGNTPLAALESLQNASGAFAWQAAVPDDNLLATVQALPAVAGKAFPFATMDVGEAAVAAPTTVPETGGTQVNPALVTALSGMFLAGSGYFLRRRSQ